MKPYYDEAGITIYHGDCRDLLPTLDVDVVITDPPYGETSLLWDRVVPGWIPMVRATSMWIFGSLRSLIDLGPELAGADWKLAQDIVWEKHNGSSLHADRFRRVHELAAQFYRGRWVDQQHEPQTTNDATARTVRAKSRPPHWNRIDQRAEYSSHDGGPRLMRSVIRVRSEHGRAEHPTQKPVGIIAPLIAYSLPAGGGPPRPVHRFGLDIARGEGRRHASDRHRD